MTVSRRAFLAGAGALAVAPLLPPVPAGDVKWWHAALPEATKELAAINMITPGPWLGFVGTRTYMATVGGGLELITEPVTPEEFYAREGD